MTELFPTFLKLAGRKVLVVGGGRVAAAKLPALVEAGAAVTVVAPEISAALRATRVKLVERAFRPHDLDDAWFVVAAAPPEVNRVVAQAAEDRRVFVNAVDDPAHATAYAGGVLRRDGVTVAISTTGDAPALAGLLREAIDAVLPDDLDAWIDVAKRLRADWRAAGTPMAARRPLLLDALVRLDDEKRRGFAAGLGDRTGAMVSLVGAGPGDPGLLTLKGADRLAHADLVLYDALVTPGMLALARRAQRFYVGKRAGRKAIEKETIHRLMIRAARRGRRVVRLKGGDPFVLGRGGEEALALAAAGVPFEIIPGVSAAVAAPELAGIPVTHRGVTSAFAVISGHAEEAYAPIVDSMAPGAATLVFLMGLALRERIATRLLDRGWSPATPTAVLYGVSTADEAVWRGSLGGLASGAPDGSSDAPGTIVIGDVVALGAQIAAAMTHGRLKAHGSGLKQDLRA